MITHQVDQKSFLKLVLDNSFDIAMIKILKVFKRL